LLHGPQDAKRKRSCFQVKSLSSTAVRGLCGSVLSEMVCWRKYNNVSCASDQVRRSNNISQLLQPNAIPVLQQRLINGERATKSSWGRESEVLTIESS
jgi:hypothetical protein